MINLCVSSTGFDSLLRKFPLKRKFPPRISHNIWTICVFQPLFIEISCMRCLVSRGNVFYLLNVFFPRFIRSIGKVVQPVKSISSNHSSSMTTTASQKNQLYRWMCFLIDFLIMYHKNYDLTHNLLDVCNYI